MTSSSTKFSLIPSVVLEVDIPDSFEGSWYTGQVHVGFKDAVFKPSSPCRHATELYNILLIEIETNNIAHLFRRRA